MGMPEGFDPKIISDTLEISKSKLEGMSRKGKALVDGKGIFRVADAIQSAIGE